MNRRNVLLASGTALTTAIAGCSESDTTNRQTGNTNNTEDTGDAGSSGNDGGSSDSSGSGGQQDRVELQNHEWYNGGQFSAGVKGRLKNVSGEQLSYVEVQIYFLDADGVQISEGLDNTTELAADRIWEFDAMFMGEDPNRVENYEIETSVDNY